MWYLERNVKNIKEVDRLNIGYNDSYEMRSEYIGPKYFSNDPALLEEILKKRKQEKAMAVYKEMIEKMAEITSVCKNRNTAKLHDSIDAPF